MSHIGVSSALCDSMRHCQNAQKSSLYRGAAKPIYSDNKFACIGVQPGQGKRGVSDFTYHAAKMPPSHWNNIVDYVKKVETVLKEYVSTDEIRRLDHGRKLVGYKTMCPMPGLEPSLPPQIFWGVAIGEDVHLPCHTDVDFSYSVVAVHMDGCSYLYKDRIVAFFCFPRWGMAVALRCGDVLIFNPLEPHAISSRCRNDEKVYVVSIYLKTAVVGLNDNNIY